MKSSVTLYIWTGLIIALLLIAVWTRDDTFINVEKNNGKRKLLEVETISIDPKKPEALSDDVVKFAFWAKNDGCTKEKLSKLEDEQTINVLKSIGIEKSDFINNKNCKLSVEEYEKLEEMMKDPLDAGEGVPNEVQIPPSNQKSTSFKLSTIFSSLKYFTFFSLIIISSSFIFMI